MTKRILPALLLMIGTYSRSHSQEIYEIPSGKQTRWTSFENPTGAKGRGGTENKSAKGHAYDIVAPHSTTVMLDYKGAGIIGRIWLTVNER